MKTISYLCECGKSNLIKTKKRPNPVVPIFFFCGGCGKPNYDFCTKCGHQSPIEYKNQFCTRCGAGDLEIKKGTPCADTWGILRTYFMPSIISLPIIIYFHDHFTKFHIPKIEKYIPSYMSLASFVILFFITPGVRQIIATLIAPLATLLTGSKTPSFSLRIIARWIYWEDKPMEKAEQHLIQEALKIRTRVRWLVRKLRRRIQQRNNPADYAPEGDSPSTDGLPTSDHRE